MRFIQYMHPAAQPIPDGSGLCPANPGPRHQRKFFQVGHAHCAPLASTYFNMRKTTIYGGSNEVQRNIVSQFVLG